MRKAQSKKFITKVMFLAAVARPRHNPATNSAFDGKIGCWAIVEKVPAQRYSRNRAAGILVTKCVEVNKERCKSKLMNDVRHPCRRNSGDQVCRGQQGEIQV